MKILTNSVALAALLLATTAVAQKSTIEGNAVGADGRPLPNAQVRVQQINAKTAVMAKTDAKGHFVAAGLAPGNYNVAVVSNGAIVGSATNVKAQSNKTARVNVSVKAAAAKVAAAPQKEPRSDYIPPPTGSHMGGWQKRGAKVSNEPEYGAQNVGRMSSEYLNRSQSSRQQPSVPGAP